MPQITTIIPAQQIRAANRLLDGYKHLANDLTVPMKRFGVYYLAVIDKTFLSQGRPAGSWPKLSRYTLEMRDHRTKRRNVTSIAALIDRGNLRRSFSMQAQPKGLRVGTSDKRAAKHQKGGSIRRPAVTIRPKKKKVLHFFVGGKEVFTQQVTLPARMFTVPQRKMITWTPADDKRLEEIHERFFREQAAKFKGRAL